MGLEHYEILDGKVHVYKRGNSRFWQCSTYLGGRNHRQSTKEVTLREAKEFAELWYHELRVAVRLRRLGSSLTGHLDAPQPTEGSATHSVGTDMRRAALHRRTPTRPAKGSGPTFRDAADEFLKEFGVMTLGERNEQYVDSKGQILKVHLLPFLADKPVAAITSGTAQEYRVHRATSRKNRWSGEIQRPSRSTLHKEIVCLRQVLKTANRKGWIPAVPDLSAAY